MVGVGWASSGQLHRITGGHHTMSYSSPGTRRWGHEQGQVGKAKLSLRRGSSHGQFMPLACRLEP